MRKPTADQMARLLCDLEDGVRADLPPGHPCRYGVPPSHHDQHRAAGRRAAARLAQSGLREQAVAQVSAKLAAEAARVSAERVVDCERAVDDARLQLNVALNALAAAREAAALYAG